MATLTSLPSLQPHHNSPSYSSYPRKMSLNSLLKYIPGSHAHTKSNISPPYSPTRRHSIISPVPTTRRSPSSPSNSVESPSASGMSANERVMGRYDLRERAVKIVEGVSRGWDIYGDKGDVEGQRKGKWEVEDLISEDLSVQPFNIQDDDDEATPEVMTREEALERWRKIRGEKERQGYEMRVKEAVVDETQRKVWVYSEILAREAIAQEPGRVGVVDERETGLSLVKERVDMLSFDPEGRMCATLGWYRRRSRVLREDD